MCKSKRLFIFFVVELGGYYQDIIIKTLALLCAGGKI